jgi:D-alanyl-D-alanine carboxypeptidase/D-alanyl-D-alanine-endopeptidase (penicillin-binding protein 4)
MRSRLFIFVLVLASAISVAPARAVLSPESIPAAFEQLLNSPALSNPAMILIDASTGTVVYEKNVNSQRKPASVMKILSGATALEYLNPASTFLTKVSLGTESKTLVITGSFDPWFSLDDLVASKMHRTSLPRIAFNSMSALKKANGGSLKNIKVLYTGLYSQDVANLRSFWAKRGFKPVMKAVGSDTAVTSSQATILESTSPTMLEILDFTLLNSDNLLAERLARLASRAAGHSFDDKGVAITFDELLARFHIDSSKLIIVDASGLSKENRVTAKIIGELLYNVRKDEKFSLLFQALPISGVSGTLKDRFITTAPNAVGLVHAKTGTLNGTVTLAGYVESADREYVFVTLADEIPKGSRASDKARAAIDRMLGRIAAPNIESEISTASQLP